MTVSSPTPAGGTPGMGAALGGGLAARLRPWSRATRPHPALLLFPVPALVLYIVFFVVPTIQGVQYAVTNWDGFSANAQQVGTRNFERIVTADDLFRNALTNNLKFMLVVVIFQTFISLALAVLLVKNSRGSVVLRSLFFFPTILSSVSVAFIWKFIYDPNFGLINSILRVVGLDGLTQAFLGDDTKAIYWVAVTQVWFHVGQMMVIYVAGLQQIPVELYESASVDGANRWQQFRSVTWPMIAPATAIVMAYTTIQSFKAFDLILGLGGNPPKTSLDILSTRIYGGFANSEFGYAAAESIVFMILIALLTWAQRRMVRLVNQEA